LEDTMDVASVPATRRIAREAIDSKLSFFRLEKKFRTDIRFRGIKPQKIFKVVFRKWNILLLKLVYLASCSTHAQLVESVDPA